MRIKIAVLAGHSGVHNGQYLTNGKKHLHDFPCHLGNLFCEGVSNRHILAKFVEIAKEADLYDVEVLSHEWKDFTAGYRARLANASHKKRKIDMLIDFHSDAQAYNARNFKQSDLTASGYSFHIAVNASKTSRNFSDALAAEYKKALPKFLHRKHKANQSYWERGEKHTGAPLGTVSIVNHTVCPAVVIENLFMTNETDAKFLLDPENQHTLAMCAHLAIVNFFKLSKES